MFEQLSQDYWESVWKGARLPQRVLPDEIPDHHNLFNLFLPGGNSRKTLIEIGCAPGKWMHYFAKHFGYAVTGLDYATDACELTKQNLALLHTEAEVIREDFLEYQSDRKFDVVFSFGFVEHFTNVNAIIARLVCLMNPDGGYIITVIPNLCGLNGLISRTFRPKVFYGHVKIALSELISLHKDAGIETLFADFIGGIYVTHPMQKNSFSIEHPRISRFINLPIRALNRSVKTAEVKTNRFPRSAYLSRSLMYIGQKENRDHEINS